MGLEYSGKDLQKIWTRILGKFDSWVRMQDYHSQLDRLKYPPPCCCSTVSLPTLPHLLSISPFGHVVDVLIYIPC